MPEAVRPTQREAALAAGHAPVRVLVVDDTPDVRRLIAGVLALHDHAWRVVAEARNGEEALAQARAARPDVILLDLAMPVMDGLEALPLLRRAAPDAVLVVLTGYPADAARDSALSAGAHAFAEKESLVSTLVPRLEAALALHGPQRWRGEVPDGVQHPAP